MTSQLNVDTIVDKAGSGGSNIKIANTSTYVSDGGSATQNTVQSLTKAWCHADQHVSQDSFNVSAIDDDATGRYSINFSNNMSNANFGGSITGINTSYNNEQNRGTTFYTCQHSDTNGNGNDQNNCNWLVTGDLA
jgi:hypothetical protein